MILPAVQQRYLRYNFIFVLNRQSQTKSLFNCVDSDLEMLYAVSCYIRGEDALFDLKNE